MELMKLTSTGKIKRLEAREIAEKMAEQRRQSKVFIVEAFINRSNDFVSISSYSITTQTVDLILSLLSVLSYGGCPAIKI